MTRKKRVWRRLGLLGTWALAGLALIMVVSVVAFYKLSNVPAPSDIPQDQVATIEYADGSPMARIGSVDRTIVALSQVSDQVKWAVLAAEDRNFYSEPGISIKGTLRAALSDLTGGSTQGGSGITQQYVKNAYLSSQQTLSRKFKELAIAVKLSREYSKDQILEYYLNTVYFGRGAYGIQAAAQVFFNTTAAQLNTAQAALLAGLLQSPSYDDPATNPSAAKQRWNYVLDGLVTTKHLDAATRASEQFPPTQSIQEGNGLGASTATAFIVQQVKDELVADGISEGELYAKGLVIKTTIDPAAQAAAISAVNKTFANLTAKQKNVKNALVAVNPSSGAVLAYYGGPDGPGYNGQPDYNDYAGVGCRPPGSSFKPYTLATALSQTLQDKQPGYTIKSVFNGSSTVVIDGTSISNDPSDKSVSGFKPLDYAMKVSLNTTFDGLAYAVGPSAVATTAHAAGISATCGGNKTLQDSDGTTSFGIGIGDYPVSPLDQAAGFATFANGGIQNNAYFISQVTDSQGKVVFTHRGAPKQVMDPRVANDVTLTLEPIAAYSNVPLSAGRVNAAKTGTEGIEASSGVPSSAVGQNSDAWMVGYTPQVSAAVWVGSGSSTVPIYSSAGGEEYGRDLPGKTWQLFMNTYLAKAPKVSMATKQEVTAFAGAQATVSTTPPSTTAAPSTSAAPSTPVAPTTSALPAPSTSVIPTPTPAIPSPACTPVLPAC
jgi:membrane peptidoglycan carboxypeptidase